MAVENKTVDRKLFGRLGSRKTRTRIRRMPARFQSALMGTIRPWRRTIPLLGMLSLLQAFSPGCAFYSPSVSEQRDDSGRFEFRESAGRDGVVIGAPHGATERGANRLAKAISERTGAGLVVAYGFKSRRLSVTQPLVTSRPYPSEASGAFERVSVFREYRRMLRMAARGTLELYLGIRNTDEPELADRIEVATSGLTHEEARAVKESYLRIRDRMTDGNGGAKLALMIEPADRISWRTAGVKHHGVLLYAERGMNLRVPSSLHGKPLEAIYGEILGQWIDEVIGHLRENPLRLPQTRVRIMEWGRIELTRSRRRLAGVVVGAPHGSFDRNTAEMVKQISYLTGIASVVANGFTPTEAGGWRINVNRPTEKTFPSDGSELYSPRARQVYRAFRALVLEAAAGELTLYVDVHRYNTGSRIQVATVGIGRDEARILKTRYYEIRDRYLLGQPAVPAADFAIEPLEEVAMRASGAKSEGILSVARKGLHFELSSRTVFATAEARALYTRIIADLLVESLRTLLGGRLDATKALHREAAFTLHSNSLLTTFGR